MNALLLPGLSIAVAGALFASFAIGPADIPIGDLFTNLIEGGVTPEALIAREIRLPRAILGALVGKSVV